MTDFLELGRDRHCSMQNCSQVHLPSVLLNQNYSVIKKGDGSQLYVDTKTDVFFPESLRLLYM